MKPKPQANGVSNIDLVDQLKSESTKLDVIAQKLDIVVNLLLDIVPTETFGDPRDYTKKLKHLDLATRSTLRPADADRIFGRPSKDISSRRREIATAKKRKTVKKDRKKAGQPVIPE